MCVCVCDVSFVKHLAIPLCGTVAAALLHIGGKVVASHLQLPLHSALSLIAEQLVVARLHTGIEPDTSHLQVPEHALCALSLHGRAAVTLLHPLSAECDPSTPL